MTAEPYRLPETIGAVQAPGFELPICYELAPEYEPRVQPYHGGGTATMRVATGSFVIREARILGSKPWTLPVPDWMAELIRADAAKRGIRVHP